MSYADDVFIKMCQDILENGTSTEDRYGKMEHRHIRSRNSEW